MVPDDAWTRCIHGSDKLQKAGSEVSLNSPSYATLSYLTMLPNIYNCFQSFTVTHVSGYVSPNHLSHFMPNYKLYNASLNRSCMISLRHVTWLTSITILTIPSFYTIRLCSGVDYIKYTYNAPPSLLQDHTANMGKTGTRPPKRQISLI